MFVISDESSEGERCFRSRRERKRGMFNEGSYIYVFAREDFLVEILIWIGTFEAQLN